MHKSNAPNLVQLFVPRMSFCKCHSLAGANYDDIVPEELM